MKVREKEGIKFKRFRSSCVERKPLLGASEGNRNDKKFINFVLVSTIECSSMQRHRKRWSRTSSHSRESRTAVVPLSICSNDEKVENDSSKRTLYGFFTRGQVRPVEGFTAHRHKGEC